MEKDKRLAATARLLEVMNTLRRECPWDREQTFDSLRSNTIEETYELADAITDHNMEGIKEELGAFSQRFTVAKLTPSFSANSDWLRFRRERISLI